MPEQLTIFDINLSALQDIVNEDIGLFIDQTFQEQPFFSWAEKLKEMARSTLIQKADGMFLYVSSQFSVLRRHQSLARIEKALNNLPNGLDETYRRILDAVHSDYQEQVANTLTWLIYSLRPLYIDELAEIFVLDPTATPILEKAERLQSVEAVLSFLPGFVIRVPVTIDDNGPRHKQGTTEIRFSHFSIQEYLTSKRTIESQAYFSPRNETMSHLHIAESCLSYNLQRSSSVSTSEVSTEETYDLRFYVARQGPKHLDKVPYRLWKAPIIDKVQQTFVAQSQAFLNIYRLSGLQAYDRRHEMLATPLFYAVVAGLYELSTYLIKHGADVNEFSVNKVGEITTPLGVAIGAKRTDLTKLLLDHKADPNLVDGARGRPLSIAAGTGAYEIVTLLIGCGANIDSTNGNALHTAIRHGDQKMVQLLLDHKANVNFPQRKYGSPLEAAAGWGYLSIARLLLESDRGTNIDIKSEKYGNAIQAAISNDGLESIKIADLLLSKGAQVDPPGKEWEMLLARIIEAGPYGNQRAQRLRNFQTDPRGYINSRLRELPGEMVLEKEQERKRREELKRTEEQKRVGEQTQREEMRELQSRQRLLLQKVDSPGITDKTGRPFGDLMRQARTKIQERLGSKQHYGVEKFFNLPLPKMLCDECDGTMPFVHYHCKLCGDGNFDLCQSCVDKGTICGNDDHRLIRRFIKDNKIVEEWEVTEEERNSILANEVAAEIPAQKDSAPQEDQVTEEHHDS